ncbi:hypothetical protein [Bradyrhizobium sp. NP1]|uniref:hypothetical protein n=1 Tax=Bradyrhizobium sp. NP1 TaxID=3049772 RepID=UPI0025A6097A|nr:hypothetical protein [Bradyrhizobium sp. NP1]WJR81424.1 hypothetical protein QOU61_17235 [Bradyrhizobium sp. NP1]
MRIGGAILLVAGVLLCLTIVWATIGFLMMGFGLICLNLAELRQKRLVPLARKRSENTSVARPSSQADRKEPELVVRREAPPPAASIAAVDTEQHPSYPAEQVHHAFPPDPAASPAAPPLAVRAERGPPMSVESANVAPEPSAQSLQRRRPASRLVPTNANSYDGEKWRAIARDDADVARSIDALAPFGKKYVDQLATAYLAFNDKSHLPVIMKMIAATIRKDTGRDLASPDDDAGMDLVNVVLSEARNASGAAAAPAFSEPQTREPLPKVEPRRRPDEADTKARIATTEAAARAKQPTTSRVGALPAARSSDTTQSPPRPREPIDGDEARDLTDLFNKIA